MTESSLAEISKALDHLKHKFSDDPDVSHAICMEELQKSIQKEINKKGLSNNLICALSKGGVFFEVEIKNLKLVGETKEVEFSYFCRKIIFLGNEISSHFSIRNKDLSVNISKSPFPSIEDIRYYDKVFFEFSGNTSKCPINFLASEKDTMNVVLKDNNNLSGLFFKDTNSSKYEVSLIGKNRIDFLGKIPDSNEFDISFNRHQNIDPENKNISHHKRIFLALRKKMTVQGDKVQESILTKEIMKCEKAILKKDPWHLSWQDRMILWLEEKVSDFGFSWFRALIILLFFNAVFAIFVCEFSRLDWGHIWIRSLDPTFHIKGIYRHGTIGIAIVMVFQKVILAFFLYEIIKSLRRFSRK